MALTGFSQSFPTRAGFGYFLHFLKPGAPILSPPLSVMVTVAVLKHNNQQNLGRKEFIWFKFPYHCLSPMEVRTGTQAGQEAGGRS